MIGLGSGLAILAIIELCNTPTGWFGSRHHNKFILTTYFCVDAVVLPLQLLLAALLLVQAFPKYSYDFQNACMTYNGAGTDYAACSAYYLDDRTAGWRLVWLSYYQRAQAAATKGTYFKRIVTLQSTGLCCGFGRPMHCEEDTRSFPSELVSGNVWDAYTAQRVLCGPSESYYPNTSYCEHYVNPAAANLEVAGCYYDYTLGDCTTADVEDGARGCAATLEEYVSGWVRVQAAIVLGLTVFQATAMCMACCMCWKKREDDVLPGYMQEPPADPYRLKVEAAHETVVVGSQIKTTTFRPQQPGGGGGGGGGEGR
eukprot:CAMPEP_0194712414 /NCGR_PEP_ID=MMETSP0296-20130528/4503_1 /TAXON_ID=39354 /ORGANISM="Heterosigma akashiwo, Strain CCMP2393" /LENGTH=312 /DNA_ID=CAMNT_0039610791 /DNA_START=153 /DNA_END=1087 /DNA_ORIENTATION=+